MMAWDIGAQNEKVGIKTSTKGWQMIHEEARRFHQHREGDLVPDDVLMRALYNLVKGKKIEVSFKL